MTIRTFAALSVAVTSWLSAGSASAQLAPPGSSGAAMGHVHFVTRNVEAHRRFWTMLGGTPTKNGSLEMFQFPGAFVLVRQGDSSGGTAGSVMNHIGFQVQRIAEWLPKFAAAGLPMESVRPTQVMVTGPDDVRVEITEDPSIGVPIRMHHLHYMVADPLAAQAWYQKTFGAAPGRRATFDTGDLPGVNLTFGKATEATVKTQGRVLDHVGFEIRGLESFTKTLEATGVKLDRPYLHVATVPGLAIAFLTDPYGTNIELTEGLSPPAGAR